MSSIDMLIRFGIKENIARSSFFIPWQWMEFITESTYKNGEETEF
jgi:hypothetical protein